MKFPDIRYIVSITLFFVFWGLFMLNMNISERGTYTLASENLRTSAESFRLNLAVEKRSTTIEDISESESWTKFESQLSAYADRLELLREQKRSQGRILRWLYLASGILMLIFTIARVSSSRKTKQIKMQNKAQ